MRVRPSKMDRLVRAAVVLLAANMVIAGAAAEPYERGESPQRFALELKFGPYSPNIDSEFSGGTTPFEDVFGSGTALLSSMEFDVQLLHAFGSLGVGLSVGYYNGSAQPCSSPSDEEDTSNCDTKLEGDKTKLTLVPLALLAVYRLDVMADRFSVPLVPYVKFGLNYTLWWMRQGDGSVSRDGAGNAGKGGNFGWQLNLGLALRLDPLEPGSARKLDGDYGVNHSYLFAELLHVRTGGEPKFGDTTFMGGLALEF